MTINIQNSHKGGQTRNDGKSGANPRPSRPQPRP